MGIFSFLKKEDSPDVESPAATVTATESVPDMPKPGADAPSYDSYGLNVGALTAPVVDPAADASEVGPMDPARTAALQGPIIEVIKTVYDPEIPVDIYELGLIYDIVVDAENRVLVKMTLTSPACPSAQQIPSEVRYKVKAVPGVTDACVEIVWEPPWDKDRMSGAAKISVGFY